MSDEQIAKALGQIIGKLEALDTRFRDYLEEHRQQHLVINSKLEEHSAQINQARGAKAAVVAIAAVISAVVGALGAKISRLFQ